MGTVVIPTHGRVHKQTTLQGLPAAMHPMIVLVASLADEAKELRKLYPTVTVKLAKVSSIAQKRHWIMKNIPGDVIMLDDDLVFSARCPERLRIWDGEGYKAKEGAFLARATDAQVAQGFEQIFSLLGSGWGMVGVSPRLNNNRIQKALSTPARVMYAFGVNAKAYTDLKLKFDEVECREDFNVALRMLKGGYTVGTLNELAVDQRGFGAAGGASTERSMEHSNEQAEFLAKLHPGLVRTTKKEYTSSIPRVEVVISWRKAAEMGGAPCLN